MRASVGSPLGVGCYPITDAGDPMLLEQSDGVIRESGSGARRACPARRRRCAARSCECPWPWRKATVRCLSAQGVLVGERRPSVGSRTASLNVSQQMGRTSPILRVQVMTFGVGAPSSSACRLMAITSLRPSSPNPRWPLTWPGYAECWPARTALPSSRATPTAARSSRRWAQMRPTPSAWSIRGLWPG